MSSTIERDFLYLLDYERDVTFVAEQPLIIEYSDGDKRRHYTPDFHIVYLGQNWLIECKPADLIDDSDNQRIFAAALPWCASRGWNYKVITDHSLRSGHRLGNVKLLRQFAAYDIAPQTKGCIYGFLHAAAEPPTVDDVQAGVPLPAGEVHTALLNMAYHHEIALVLDAEAISNRSAVYWPGQFAERKFL